MNAKKLYIPLLTTLLFTGNSLAVFAEETKQDPPTSNENGGTPPEKPDGDTNNGNAPQGAPNGQDNNGGTPPELPDGENGQGGPMGEGGQFGGGANTQTFDYSGTYQGALSADNEEVSSSNEEISATETDQNAALVQNGGTLTIDNDTLNKSGDDTNGDNCNFYGLNSIALAVNENSLLKISNSKLNATSEGSNAIFATDNATVLAYNDTISTTADNSRGLDATYGGTILADSMNISTQGNHSASIATDRGGGNISATNSTLSTAGSGSPLLYSTGDIEVDNVTGTATGSQIAGMEGLNTILIYNSNLSSTNNAISGSDPIKNGVIIYQSTSGDAETSTGNKARFEAVNSTLSTTIDSGAMFYLTNTSANILLSNTELDFDSTNVNLLQVEGNDSNGWGQAGSNGATLTFTAMGETLSGNIVVDDISSADVYLLNNTSYTGTVTNASMNVSSNSKWVVTADSTVTNLNVEDGAQIVDESGKSVTIKVNDEVINEGESSYIITVTGSYSTTITTTEDNELSTSYIDRSNLDSTYNLSTTFNASGTQKVASNETEQTVTETEEPTSSYESTSTTNSYLVPGIILAIVVIGVIYYFSKKKH